MLIGGLLPDGLLETSGAASEKKTVALRETAHDHHPEVSCGRRKWGALLEGQSL